MRLITNMASFIQNSSLLITIWVEKHEVNKPRVGWIDHMNFNFNYNLKFAWIQMSCILIEIDG